MRLDSMFQRHAKIDGVTLIVDPIDRERSAESDNVMAVFAEEQPLTWAYVKEDIIEKLAKGGKFQDVGTGCGVFSLLVAKHTDAKNIDGYDISSRAIELATYNAQMNGVKATFLHERYSIDSAPPKTANVIGLYPPYHIYPQSVESKIPQHAKGGSLGQDSFKEQLAIANYHLADDGFIFFNQMCLGNGKPFLTDYIPEIVEECSVSYTDIMGPLATSEFLSGVYGDTQQAFQDMVVSQGETIHYCVGKITRDGLSKVVQDETILDTFGRTWDHRIKLHGEIAKHGR